MSRRHKPKLEAPVDELADMVNDLTQPLHHAEHYTMAIHNRDGSTTWQGSDWLSNHRPLVDQLVTAVESSASVEAGSGPRPGFTSKPAARLEALDAYMRIDDAAAHLVRELGGEVPFRRVKAPRPGRVDAEVRVVVDTKACIRRLHGLAQSTDEKTRRGIEQEVRSWWTQARVLTGWDSPAWKPANSCPLCGVKGGLRVRLAAKAATCVECHETWDAESIGLLADHIRLEAEMAQLPGGNRMQVGKPCHCRNCDPGYQFWIICPVCAQREGTRCAKPSDHRWPCTGLTADGAVTRPAVGQ